MCRQNNSKIMEVEATPQYCNLANHEVPAIIAIGKFKTQVYISSFRTTMYKNGGVWDV